MKTETARTLRAFAIELVIYTVLVVGYFFLVLRFVAHSLFDLEQRHIVLYGAISIALIVGQAVLLEIITTGLLRFLRGRSE
jgi:hypothetical protein